MQSRVVAGCRSTRYSGDWKWTPRGSSLAPIECVSFAHRLITASPDTQSVHITGFAPANHSRGDYPALRSSGDQPGCHAGSTAAHVASLK